MHSNCQKGRFARLGQLLVSAGHWQPDDHMRDLAEKQGRGEEYGDLLLMHYFVHRTTIATSQRYSLVGGDGGDWPSSREP